MVRQLLYFLGAGLIGAAIVHIAVLLLVPAFSDRDAWTRLAEAGEPFALLPVAGDVAGLAIANDANPFIRTYACRFIIDPGMARIVAEGEVPFWSAAIFNRQGQNVYSLNDRTNLSNRLDLIVATPLAMIELRKDLPEELAQSVFVELDDHEGLAVIRVAVPGESWTDLASRFIGSARCSPY